MDIDENYKRKWSEIISCYCISIGLLIIHLEIKKKCIENDVEAMIHNSTSDIFNEP